MSKFANIRLARVCPPARASSKIFHQSSFQASSSPISAVCSQSSAKLTQPKQQVKRHMPYIFAGGGLMVLDVLNTPKASNLAEYETSLQDPYSSSFPEPPSIIYSLFAGVS